MSAVSVSNSSRLIASARPPTATLPPAPLPPDTAPADSRATAVVPGRLPSWRAAVGLLLVGAALVALATRVDVAIATWVRHNPVSFETKQVLETARWPGHFLFTLVLAGLIVARSRDAVVGRSRAILLLLAAGVPGWSASVVKWAVGRTRPFRGAEAFDLTPLRDGLMGVFYQKNLSFPSGDATLAFATAATLGLMFPRLRAPAFAWAAIVGVARVLQGAHYPSDVVAGMVFGIVGSWAIVALAARLERRAVSPAR